MKQIQVDEIYKMEFLMSPDNLYTGKARITGIRKMDNTVLVRIAIKPGIAGYWHDIKNVRFLSDNPEEDTNGIIIATRDNLIKLRDELDKQIQALNEKIVNVREVEVEELSSFDLDLAEEVTKLSK